MSATVGAVPDHAAVGTLIDGKYEVEKVIGEGAVGLVVAARNIELGERVALKFLRHPLLELSDRFTTAAKAASAIKSEHAATIFDVGRTREGVPFLVMEFVEGKDLVAEKASLDVAAVAELAMQTCEALAAAHAKGVVHRHLRARDLFVVQRSGAPSIKVVDFGLSKAALAGSEKEADARDDLSALGVVLRDVLGGKEPTGLLDVIQKCVEKEPKDRYQNAAELAIALMPFAPKRARVSAERAGEILVLAGLAKAESVRLAPEEAPAFPAPPSSSKPVMEGRSTVSSQSAVAVPAAPPPANDKVKTVLATLAVVIGLAGTAYSITNRARQPASETTPTSEPAPKSSDVKPANPPEPVQVAPSPSVSTASVAPRAPDAAVKPMPVASARKTPVLKPGPARPAPEASTSSTAARPDATTAVPADTGTAKKPDALDIGY